MGDAGRGGARGATQGGLARGEDEACGLTGEGERAWRDLAWVGVNSPRWAGCQRRGQHLAVGKETSVGREGGIR
jgi:hypothetical protein